MLATHKNRDRHSSLSWNFKLSNRQDQSNSDPLSWQWWLYPSAKQDISHSSSRNLYLRVQRRRLGDSGSEHEHLQAIATSIAATFAALNLRPVITDFLQTVASSLKNNDSALAVLVVPTSSGYIADASFLVKRLAGVKAVTQIVSFVEFNDKINADCGHQDLESNLLCLLPLAIGGASLDPAISNEELKALESQIHNRLQCTWSAPEKLQRRRLYYVIDHLNLCATRHKWQMALGLGLDIVIITSGQWWQDPQVAAEWKTLVAGFISLDITTDRGLASRLITLLKGDIGNVHGLVPGADKYLTAVARAASALGLPTSSPEAYTISTSKQLTRDLEQPIGTSFEIRSMTDLHMRLKNQPINDYPLISKPAHGSMSTCVFKSDNETELLANVSKTFAAWRAGDAIVIERYCEGPECDVNIVLLDGELLFSEIVDEPPSTADLDSNSPMATFAESQAITPSILPANEQADLISSVRNSVLRQGFRSGVFHCEARVRDSRMHYAPLPGSQAMLDLAPAVAENPTQQPSTFLLEVNARCPGLMSASATLLTSGVDFWSLQLLAAVGEWERFAHNAARFVDEECHVMLDTYFVDVGARFVQALFPGLDISNIGKPYIDEQNNPMTELGRDVTSHVVRHAAMVKPAAMYGGEPDKWLWLETVVLLSNESRASLLLASERLRLRYEAVVMQRDRQCLEEEDAEMGSSALQSSQ
jgi:hypothetical protein